MTKEAMKIYGKCGRGKKLVLLCCLLFAVSLPALASGRTAGKEAENGMELAGKVSAGGLWARQKYALVIGNGNYTGVSRLKNPENDAADMKAA
ncbi:MAG: caspase family protein, partial [Treponema sp.]|nr:caspase family protein [Treponema sp.]